MRVRTEVRVCMKQNTADCSSADHICEYYMHVGLPTSERVTTDSNTGPKGSW